MKIYKQLALSAVLAWSVFSVTNTMAATELQKLTAIIDGLDNLVATQQPGGYWNYGGYEQASTGAAVLAFMSQKNNWEKLGSHTATYQATVDKAVAYLLATASTGSVSTRNDGIPICPNGAFSCTDIGWYGAGESSYTTGLVASGLATYATGKASVIATTTGPLAGLTWGQIAQGITNLWSAYQSTAVNPGAPLVGGWRYIFGAYDSDMSTTQWGIISLIYDESLGAITPAIVKTDLAKWLAFAQDPISGAGCYQGPGSGYCEQANTGGLLLGLKYVGKLISDPAVQKALTYLNNNWPQDANNTFFGNFGQPYAMWGVYKGLDVNIGVKDNTFITNLKTTCGAPANLPGNPSGSVPCNWWEDYNESLVNSQNADGSWNGYAYWYGPLATAFNISILGATEIPPQGLCDVAAPIGQIDKLDLALISKSRGQVPTAKDPRDSNLDGKIDPADVKACIPKCTFSNCSVTQSTPPLPVP